MILGLGSEGKQAAASFPMNRRSATDAFTFINFEIRVLRELGFLLLFFVLPFKLSSFREKSSKELSFEAKVKRIS